MIKKITNIDLNIMKECEKDILLNKKLTNISPSNMYEILFDCENFDKIFNIFLKELKEDTNRNSDVYVKNMWGYIQNEKDDQSINLIGNFKNQIIIPSEYSFIYFIKSETTNIYLKNKNNKIEIADINAGDILIFNTNEFVEDKSKDKERIALIGSISFNIEDMSQIKSTII